MAAQQIAIVWFKRDFRLRDHAPLCAAIETRLPVLFLALEEPSVRAHEAMDERHFRFVRESVADMNAALAALQSKVHLIQMEALDCFQLLSEYYQINHLFSHEESGLGLTYHRDIAVGKWCQAKGICWQEFPTNGIQRGIKNRERWAKDWLVTMRAPMQHPSLQKMTSAHLPEVLLPFEVDEAKHQVSHPMQKGGSSNANAVLKSFLTERGKGYSRAISKPEASRTHCSRLSPYLAWGNLSIRQVYQALQEALPGSGFKRDLSSFQSRLYWHCHFIQKFENECSMEYRNHNKAFDGIRTEENKAFTEAWMQGKTGYPLIDACMRCVRETGYINFRMRAMLVSFLTHHLWQPWQAGAAFLARQFLDFEPGIHYPQFQMQAGTVGTHVFRVYNPVIQAEKHDPDARFIKKWLPELAPLPDHLARAPWTATALEAMFYNFHLGIDYSERIVDISQTGPHAQKTLFALAQTPEARTEAAKILLRHSNPNRSAFASGEMEEDEDEGI